MTEPKVVVSEHRSTAIVAQQKFEMGATIFRNVPGATRVTLTKFGADTDVPEDKVLIMSMVSPTAASGYYARTELGKTYTPPATGFSAGYLSDVLRMETHTWVVKTLTTAWSSTSPRSSRESIEKTSAGTHALFAASVRPASVRSAL